MRHPTDSVRLPVRTRSDEPGQRDRVEMLNDVAGWLEEIDRVLDTITPHERLAQGVRRRRRPISLAVDALVAT